MTRSQFPRPWRPLRGSYTAAGYSRRGRFNGRDAGSVLSFAMLAQPLIVSLSGGLELVARSVEPQFVAAGPGAMTASFLTTWMWQTALAAGLKSISCVLRDQGASLVRDIAAWVWSTLMKAAWSEFVDWTYGLALRWARTLPFWPKPDRDDSPDRRRRPFWDRWRRRRRRRREERRERW